MDYPKLTPKQAQFVQEYLIDLNATQAAIRAGYSPKRADEQGYENLRKPEIQTALAAERQRLAATLQITPERVLQEYARLAFADLRRVASWDTEGVHFHDSAALGDQDAAAIAEVHEDTRIVATEQGEVRTVKKRLKMHDKKGALDSLAKHLKLFRDDTTPLPDVHVHVHTARERLSERLAHLATRHAEDATNGQ
jgi:phage terminase small subunit